MKTITFNTLNALYHYFGECENFIFLDSSKTDARNTRSLLFLDPLERLQFRYGDDERQFLEKIEKHQVQGCSIAGWFGYEFGYLLEQSLNRQVGLKVAEGEVLADLGVFSSHYTFDHRTGKTNFPAFANSTGHAAYQIDNIRLSITEEEYLQALQKILAYIEAGDTYQVNFTLKLFFDFCGSPESFYAALRHNQSVSYGSYIRWQDERIMSFSPELFFWKKGGEIMVRPMKGTMKRGRTIAEDELQRQKLRSDIKNQSENVMIVDLLRNDLGHLMHQLPEGEVKVDSLFDVETYETLLQMTSTIQARSAKSSLEKVSLYSLLQAMFPCGSVTGAPKIRTMEIINELEKQSRGVYTGAIGCLLPEGETIFNVPIRTIVLNGKSGEMGIGSGIVHDSDPRQEWQECLLKGHFLTQPQQRFQLIETILCHPEHGLFLLEDHLQRLHESARYFLFHCDCDEISTALKHRADELQNSAGRLRLVLEKDGTFQIDAQECEIPSSLELPQKPPLTKTDNYVGLSQQRIDSDSLWYYHKTTNRQMYNKTYAQAVENGLYDIVFENQDGLITEGCITNIFLYKDGVYRTPPSRDGLLPGVMRAHLLQHSQVPIKEQSLTVADLQQAEAIYLCNSVRGIVQVAFEQTS
ncbi:MAG: aminodeoxychorismate synthase component I [Desulfocapsaceae bacterium]|nr:aminodeoxychorismate synthase component I [Desulfocapsaceae bacterium]